MFCFVHRRNHQKYLDLDIVRESEKGLEANSGFHLKLEARGWRSVDES